MPEDSEFVKFHGTKHISEDCEPCNPEESASLLILSHIHKLESERCINIKFCKAILLCDGPKLDGDCSMEVTAEFFEQSGEIVGDGYKMISL